MGLQYLLIGCFFLLNPYFSIIDIFPDFIGCIFLMKGLSKLTKISASFEFAYKQFGLLLAISVVRLCCIPLITDTKEIWPLIIVLCAGLGEAFLSIRAFNAIFDGFSSTAQAPENALFVRWKETKQITVIFLILKQVIAVIPELCMLSTGEYGVVTLDGIQSIANYRTPLLFVGLFIGFFVGIAWYIQIRRYLKQVIADRAYQTHLEETYRHRYTSVSAVYIADQLKVAMGLLIAAVILSLELIFDGVNYLPHFIGAILFYLAAKKLASLPGAAANSQGKSTARLAVIYGVVSIPRFIYSIIFTNRIFGEYLASKEEGLQLAYSDVLISYLYRDFTTIYGFIALIVMALIEAIVFILLLLAFYRMVRELILQHTRESIPQPSASADGEDENEEYDYQFFLDSKKSTSLLKKKDDFVTELTAPLVRSRILGILTAISMVAASICVALFPSYWLIDTILRIIWVAATYAFLSKLKDEISTHYTFLTREEDLHHLTH